MAGKLTGKIAIVTGASRGIGKAIAIAYAREGAKVVVAARSEEPREKGPPGTIHETVKAIEAVGGTALAVRCNIGYEEEVEAMVKKTLEAFGRIDVLVNNAARGAFQSLLKDPVGLFDAVLRINVRGSFLCARAALPSMMKLGRGSIINISSMAAVSRDPFRGAYSVSKAALEQLTYLLAEEVKGHNIAVNAMRPGWIRSEGLVFAMPGRDWTGAKEPETVVPAAIYLAGCDATFTGRLVEAQEFGITWP